MEVVSIFNSDEKRDHWAASRRTATFADMSNAMRRH
jgi:hypothetical protein